MTRKRWQTTSYDKEVAAQIAQDHDLNPFAALLATSRGLLSDTVIEEFFARSEFELCDPFTLPDMDKAVDRLETAIQDGESILVFGDYDADGVTATALLVSYLETRGAMVQSYIPDRLTEGYGLSNEAVYVIKDKGAKIVLTVDNGISAIEEALLIASLGMELIITDHHKPKDILPKALAVIDPHRDDSACRFKDFAGVGVAFKLVCALDGGDPYDLLQEYGDLVAIGTIGDIVPLVGENRIIARTGIEMINNIPRTGIQALLNAAGQKNDLINSSSVAYILSPRINAAGRMGSAQRALELLLTEDEDVAQKIAEEINEENMLRKRTEDEILQKAEQMFTETPERRLDRIIVVAGEGWHNGVIGIVASRLADKYGRPCIVISKDGSSARGSGRSIEGFSLYNAIEAVSTYLTHFGGHPLAAGLGISSDRIEDFRVAINKYAQNEEMPFPIQRIDFRLNPKSIDTDLVRAVEVFEPYGAGNPRPVFGLFGVKIETVQPVTEGKHTRIQVSKGLTKINAIIFNCNTGGFPYVKGDCVDLAVTLELNNYRETLSVNTRVVNLRMAGMDEDKLLMGLRKYERFVRGESLESLSAASLLPGRELFALIYRVIKDNDGFFIDFEKLCYQVNDNGERFAAIMIAVDIMLDLGLIDKKEHSYRLNEVNNKVDLDNSEILIRLKNKLSINA